MTNILICFYGIKLVRVISFFVLALSFILTAIIIAYLLSTLVRTVTRLDIQNSSSTSSMMVLSKRVSHLEEKCSSNSAPGKSSVQNLMDNGSEDVFIN